jgi:hypothetical protein
VLQDVFNQCLLSVPSVDIWRVYLQFIKKSYPDPGLRQEVLNAFDVALQNIGILYAECQRL